MKGRSLLCYAEGSDGHWEAICIDLDIAVQGTSFEEVFAALREAIALYRETVAGLTPDERQTLVERPAPLSVRLKFLGYALRDLFVRHDADKERHQFTVPIAA